MCESDIIIIPSTSSFITNSIRNASEAGITNSIRNASEAGITDNRLITDNK